MDNGRGKSEMGHDRKKKKREVTRDQGDAYTPRAWATPLVGERGPTGMCAIRRTQCRCKTKTAIVPAWGLEEWRAMRIRLSGAGAVVPTWRYLGVFPAARTFAARRVPKVTAWESDATRTIADRTWDRHIRK